MLGAAQAGRHSSLQAAPAARRRGPDRRRPGRRPPPWSRPTRSWPRIPPCATAIDELLGPRPIPRQEGPWGSGPSGPACTLKGWHASSPARRAAGGWPSRPAGYPADQRPRQGRACSPPSCLDRRARWPGPASSTCTRAPARSAWRRCPAAPRTCCWSSPAPAASRVIGRTSPRSACPAPRWSPTGWSGCWPAARPAGRYDVVFADPPYAVPDEEVTRMLGRLRTGLAGPRSAGHRGARHPVRACDLAGRIRGRPVAPVRGSHLLVRSRPSRVNMQRAEPERGDTRASRRLSGFLRSR